MWGSHLRNYSPPTPSPSQYKYLGLTLTEFLNYDVMAANVAKSAIKFWVLVIYKSKSNHGGSPYECFTKLYDSLIWPVIDYGSRIWGTNRGTCIETVQNRACRYFMVVGKYTGRPILLYKEIWTGFHHKLKSGNPWGNAGLGLRTWIIIV